MQWVKILMVLLMPLLYEAKAAGAEITERPSVPMNPYTADMLMAMRERDRYTIYTSLEGPLGKNPEALKEYVSLPPILNTDQEKELAFELNGIYQRLTSKNPGFRDVLRTKAAELLVRAAVFGHDFSRQNIICYTRRAKPILESGNQDSTVIKLLVDLLKASPWLSR